MFSVKRNASKSVSGCRWEGKNNLHLFSNKSCYVFFIKTFLLNKHSWLNKSLAIHYHTFRKFLRRSRWAALLAPLDLRKEEKNLYIWFIDAGRQRRDVLATQLGGQDTCAAALLGRHSAQRSQPHVLSEPPGHGGVSEKPSLVNREKEASSKAPPQNYDVSMSKIKPWRGKLILLI